MAGLLLLAFTAVAWGEERFPPPEFRSGHQIPETQLSAGRAAVWAYVDVAVLGLAMGAAAYLIHKRRSRAGVFAVMALSLAYFGFWRQGCVCPIGSVQNVSQAVFGGVAIPWVVVAFFVMPLVVALIAGRVFCAGVCPLGAIQDVFVWKPVQLPRWIDAGLGLFPYAYLGLAVLMAAVGSDYIICRYDPFVGFFRMSGPGQMLFLGAILLVAGMFVGRIYCRFICPYGALLAILSPLAKWRVSITPSKCIDCRLCEKACPFGAIHPPTGARQPRIGNGERKRFAALLLCGPLLIGALAWAGHRAGPALAGMDARVMLAEAVDRSELGKALATDKDWLDAVAQSGREGADIYAEAGVVQKRFAVGGAWLGVWMGLIIWIKLVFSAVRRRSGDYTADSGNCLACARCFRLCPADANPSSITGNKDLPA